MNSFRPFLCALVPFLMNPRILAALLLTLPFSTPVRADPPNARVQLEQKARYWVEKGREDLAAATYRQILFLYPKDKRALTGLIQADILGGKTGEARPLIRTFENRYPKSPYLPVFQREDALGAKWTVLINRARKEERNRDYSRAEALFRKAFGDGFPPPSLAEEYFHLSEKIPGGRNMALSELKALTGRYPDNGTYRLAFGEILSDRGSTRRQGVRILATLARSHAPEATRARIQWKKSLVWAGDNPSFIPELSLYLKTEPDPTIEHLLEQARRRSLAEGPLPGKAFDALHRGKMKEARDRFLLLTREDPENPSYWTGLASAQLALSRPDKAAKALKRALQLPLSRTRRLEVRRLERQVRYWGLIARGRRQTRKGHLLEAERLYRLARKTEPGRTAAPDLLAGLELRQKHPHRALSIAKQVLFRHPKDPQAFSAALGALDSLGQYRYALEAIRSLSPGDRHRMERSPSFLVLEGTVYAHSGQVARADRKLEEAGQGPLPLTNRNQIARGWAYAALGQTVSLDAVVKSLKTSPGLSPEESSAIQKLEHLDLDLSVGRLLDRKDEKSARERVLAFLRDHPEDRFALREKVRVDLSTGRTDKAFVLLRSLHPENRYSNAKFAITSALESRHTKTAGKWIDETRSRWGNRTGLIILESQYLADTSHFRKARKILKKALEHSPRSVPLHLALARLDLRQNFYRDARKQALEGQNLAGEEIETRHQTDALEAANTLAAISRQEQASSGSHFEFLLGETVFTQYTQYYYTQIGGFFPVGSRKGAQGQEPVYLHAFVQGNAFTFQYHPAVTSASFLSQAYVGTTPALGLRVPTFFGSVEVDAGWGFALHDQTLTPPGIVSGLFLQGDLSADIAGGNLDLFANYTGYIDYTYFQSRYLHPFWQSPERAFALAAGPEFIVQGNSNYSAFQGGAALRFSLLPVDSTLLLDAGVLGSSAFGGIGGYEGFSWYFYY